MNLDGKLHCNIVHTRYKKTIQGRAEFRARDKEEEMINIEAIRI